MTQTVDPFYLYLSLCERLGEGNVFLLDAACETTSRYRMSLIGAAPVLEIQVKDGVTTVFAKSGLDSYLERGLAAKGFDAASTDLVASGRSSVVGPASLVYENQNVMELLEQLRQLMRALYPSDSLLSTPFAAGFLGYIGYDAVHYLEELPKTTEDDRELPDIRLQAHSFILHLVGDEVRVHDSTTALAHVLNAQARDELMAGLESVKEATADVDATTERALGILRQLDAANSLAVQSSSAFDDVSKERFERNVETAREYIKSGDIFQVVLSKRIRVPKARHPYLIYDELRRVNPSPYMFIGEYPDMRVFGASPEVQFRSVRGVAEMKPIAGTSKGRGATPDEDARLSEALFHNEKERAEHVMLVDLCRNDLGRVSQIGSVKVQDLMHVEAYSHLFHLVSEVTGELREDVSVFEALLSTFPAGTLSGAPKIRAMEIIDELETLRRGPYGGMIGMIDFEANANTAIVIRTIVEHRDTYYVQVGAGIVADSIPEAEWNECGHKAGAVLQVLGCTQRPALSHAE